MLPTNNIQSIVGAVVYDENEQKVGKVDQVLIAAADGHPTWLAVHGGIFGSRTSFIPAEIAEWLNDEVRVPVDGALVKSAPHGDADSGLSPAEEHDLRVHYGLVAPATTGAATDTSERVEPTGHDERVAPTGHVEPAERVEPTEHVERVEPAERAPQHAPIAEPLPPAAESDVDDDSVVLMEERLVVRKERVPVERVRMGKHTVTEDRQVTGDVEKERIDLETDPE